MRAPIFTPGDAPHVPPQVTVSGTMLKVLYALVPGIAAHLWFFGPGLFFQIVLAVTFALIFEAAMLKLRGQSIILFIGDYSAVVTAVLFALCIPPLAPWWISMIAMLFAIVVAKHLYGGLGHNVFNPAMVGYVVVLISFPQIMTQWLPPRPIADVIPGLYESLMAISSGHLPAQLTWDAITQATPLDTMKTGLDSGQMVPEIRRSPLFGDFGGLGWEWIANWYLLGGLYLLYSRVISWQVPASGIGSVVLLSLPLYMMDPGNHPGPFQHLFSGALMLAAFFIATDPVSGCTSALGRLWFGAGVGVITLVIRTWGGYPDGIAFGVLLMNMAAPLIDKYTKPRAYGQ